ncbi:MAG: methyltransferase domain-containing protein [Phycisphaerales bacterium]|nr:methyltransferase domain-containing protein [Phycisphaerales bacterium]
MRVRNLQPELMDDPALPIAEHRVALDMLARLNKVSATARVLWPYVQKVHTAGTTTSLLDVAAGSGDVPVAIAAHGRRAGVAIRLAMCDISPVAVEAASRRAGAEGIDATVEVRDVVRDGLSFQSASVDVVMCSLFLHHLSEADAVKVLTEMARVARRCVIVSDLRRCRAGLAAAFLASRLGTRSHVVRVDAVRSVQGAFTESELVRLGETAGMHGSSVLRCWPFRMLLVWTPP